MQTISDSADPRSSGGASVPLSVVIFALDDQINISDCIKSCAGYGDIHVVDGGSDATGQIARQLGANVHVNKLISPAQQRNWAIDHIPARHPWQFHLHADERFTEPLAREILKQIGPEGGDSTAAAYLVPGKLIFMNKWIKHGGEYPAYQARLFHRDKCRFVDSGHSCRPDARGPVAMLVNPFLRYDFSKGVADWLYRHNRQTDREADEAMESLDSRGGQISSLRYRLKARSLWRFISMYVFRLGWLDGNPGLHYCMLMAMHEYWAELKLLEKRSDWSSQTQKLAQRLMGD